MSDNLKTVVMMRHAHYERVMFEHNDNKGISEDGREQSIDVGQQIKQAYPNQKVLILTTPIIRGVQTAERVQEQTNAEELKETDSLNLKTSKDKTPDLICLIQETKEDIDLVICVTHDPNLSDVDDKNLILACHARASVFEFKGNWSDFTFKNQEQSGAKFIKHYRPKKITGSFFNL